ncbi:MAG: dephospho-CoA kinase [Phycisphaerales bacterium]|nr:dephospho-CoA kinase [Phycisphaerales bacterium]
MKAIPVIGICGGVGAGKSSVAAAFTRAGAAVVDSDQANREVLARPDVRDELVSWWGSEVVGPDGAVNRRAVAEIVFGDPAARKRLESLTHPLIGQLRAHKIEAVRESSSAKAIVLDSPLLIESKLDRECDFIVFVDADAAQREQRARESRGWSREEWMRRERCQASLDEKRSRADFVIRNDGDIRALDAQVEAVLKEVDRRILN